MTPEEFTHMIVKRYAKPADPELLMFWNGKAHATRLLIKALTGVLGEHHPLSDILLEYEKADIAASKFSHISSGNIDTLDVCAANISTYSEDLVGMIEDWRDHITANLPDVTFDSWDGCESG